MNNSYTISREELTPEDIDFKEKRFSREKKLKIIVAVLSFTTILFFILFIVFVSKNKSKEDEDKSLQKAATEVASGIGPTAKPCDNFYKFACGHYGKNNPPDMDFNQKSPFVYVGDQLGKDMRDLLESPSSTSAPDAVVKAEHGLPTAKSEIDRLGPAPILKVINAGGPNVFPSLNASWVDENWSLTEILARVRRYPYYNGIGYLELASFVPVIPSVDYRQANRTIIYVTQAKMPYGLRDEFLGPQSKHFLTLFEGVYMRIATALGASQTIAKQDAKDVMGLEVLVANATGSTKSRLDLAKIYNKMTVLQLNKRYPQLDWQEHIRHQFSEVGINVTLDDEVMVDALDYLDNILPILNQTSRRTLLNYCQWRLMFEYADFMASPVRDVKQKAFLGSSRVKARWQVCTDYTVKLFPMATGKLYVEKHFPPSKRGEIKVMIKDLKDAFRDIIRTNDWMSDATRTVALEKVDAMEEKVGYSDSRTSDTFLNEFRKNLKINTSTALDNAINSGADLFNFGARLLGKPYDRREWHFLISPVTVNAFYNPMTNSIIYPAGILQNPIYSEENIDVLSYGGIGFVIGHEVTHGFDSSGADFDKDGNMRQWWNAEDVLKFDNLANCLVEQYGKFIYANQSLDGRLTLAENIADKGGLKEAFMAYKKRVAMTKKDPSLPVLKYTPDQLFFIAAAQVWCKSLPDGFTEHKWTDVHSPNEFRVNGPMMNFKEFAKVFNCPLGSYMNPEKKCHVW
ncbi:hypothetical protein ACOMHN_036829 [Nucella lapillus]